MIVFRVAGASPSWAKVTTVSVGTSNANSKIFRQLESHFEHPCRQSHARNSHRASAQRMAKTGSRGKNPWNCHFTASFTTRQHFSSSPCQDGPFLLSTVRSVAEIGIPAFWSLSSEVLPRDSPQKSKACLLEDSGGIWLDFRHLFTNAFSVLIHGCSVRPV